MPEIRGDPVPEAPSARCRHFGACGGCSIQHLPYEEQLRRKAGHLRGLFEPFLPGEIPIHPSPAVWSYRNKMEFSFGRLGRKDPAGGPYILEGTVLGLKQKGRWDKVVDLEECPLFSPGTPALLKAVRDWARAEGLDGYDQKSGRGFLRHLLVREGKNTGQKLVMMLTAPGIFRKDSFVAAVCASCPGATVLRGVNASVSDVARAETSEVLEGPGFIEEVLNIGRPLRFRVSPFSFFQTNTLGTERLYSLVRSWVEPGLREIGDLYGGAGGISFALTDRAERILCVESNPSAVEDGRFNASLNGIANVEFIRASVEDFLSNSSFQLSAFSFVVLDPPRSGLHPKALKALMNLRPGRLLYVSCNPKALAHDLGILRTEYVVKRIEAVDLFPHTEHIETVALLER